MSSSRGHSSTRRSTGSCWWNQGPTLWPTIAPGACGKPAAVSFACANRHTSFALAPRPAVVGERAVDVAVDAIALARLGRRRPEREQARLVARVAVEIGHVVGANDIALAKGVVAFA